jgi:hypothetical protein
MQQIFPMSGGVVLRNFSAMDELQVSVLHRETALAVHIWFRKVGPAGKSTASWGPRIARMTSLPFGLRWVSFTQPDSTSNSFRNGSPCMKRSSFRAKTRGRACSASCVYSEGDRPAKRRDARRSLVRSAVPKSVIGPSQATGFLKHMGAVSKAVLS